MGFRYISLTTYHLTMLPSTKAHVDLANSREGGWWLRISAWDPRSGIHTASKTFKMQDRTGPPPSPGGGWEPRASALSLG